MDEKIRCSLNTCNKILTNKTEIEYSQELGVYFCNYDCAIEHYMDYMRSVPLDTIIDDNEEVHFVNGILIDRELEKERKQL